jgi:hypothetical protein
MLPNLTLIIAIYAIYRLLETSVHAMQRNLRLGIGQAVIALFAGWGIIELAMETVKSASQSPTIPGLR